MSEEDKKELRKIVGEVIDQKMMAVALGALTGLLIGLGLAYVL